MKKTKTHFSIIKGILFLSLFLLSISANSQCGTAGTTLILFTQTDVDNFVANNPGCTHLLGGISITGDLSGNDPITDLSGLSQITIVDGQLNITGSDLTTLNGLNIQFLGGFINIVGNDHLTDMSALGASLQSMNGNINLNNNPVLMDIDFSNLTTITLGDPNTNGIYTSFNDAATSINFGMLNSYPGGDINTSNNANVVTIDFGSLPTIPPSSSTTPNAITIVENSKLTSFDFGSLVSLFEGNMLIRNNPLLQNISER